jgi:hypothetical protein
MKRVALALAGVFLSYSLAVAGPYGYGGGPGPMMRGFGQSQYPSQNITEAKAKDMIRQFLDTNNMKDYKLSSAISKCTKMQSKNAPLIA